MQEEMSQSQMIAQQNFENSQRAKKEAEDARLAALQNQPMEQEASPAQFQHGMTEALNSLTEALRTTLAGGTTAPQQTVFEANLFSTFRKFHRKKGLERAGAWISEL